MLVLTVAVVLREEHCDELLGDVHAELVQGALHLGRGQPAVCGHTSIRTSTDERLVAEVDLVFESWTTHIQQHRRSQQLTLVGVEPHEGVLEGLLASQGRVHEAQLGLGHTQARCDALGELLVAANRRG